MKNIYRIFLVLSILAFLFATRAYIYESNTEKLEIYFLDVGQGDAIYMRTPSGHDFLIDGGPSKVLLRRLNEVMPWYDRSIDVVLESHPDADHIGGFPDLLHRYAIGEYFHPGIESPNTIDDEIRRILSDQHISLIRLARGQRIDFRDGVHFDILAPDGLSPPNDTNASSIVGLLSYGSSTILFMGDAPSTVESRIIALDPGSVHASVLKVGHHGSKSSSSEEFLKLVAPKYAVISSGAGNKYGHPNKEALDRLSLQGAQILRTDERGTIHMTMTSHEISIQ